ncbi:hypothetical protein DBR06_SOUSAS9810097 [Sousa chinensis]|uniref:Uncharacterized protein n=1 Tax=Sousa chinensis TaxID=103600 RepID=A0A484H1G4_SOUCH|nr:hypothetical protein DBR06_SOUSAS9810097 [Sousa chinensis]
MEALCPSLLCPPFTPDQPRWQVQEELTLRPALLPAASLLPSPLSRAPTNRLVLARPSDNGFGERADLAGISRGKAGPGSPEVGSGPGAARGAPGSPRPGTQCTRARRPRSEGTPAPGTLSFPPRTPPQGPRWTPRDRKCPPVGTGGAEPGGGTSGAHAPPPRSSGAVTLCSAGRAGPGPAPVGALAWPFAAAPTLGAARGPPPGPARGRRAPTPRAGPGGQRGVGGLGGHTPATPGRCPPPSRPEVRGLGRGRPRGHTHPGGVVTALTWLLREAEAR